MIRTNTFYGSMTIDKSPRSTIILIGFMSENNIENIIVQAQNEDNYENLQEIPTILCKKKSNTYLFPHDHEIPLNKNIIIRSSDGYDSGKIKLFYKIIKYNILSGTKSCFTYPKLIEYNCSKGNRHTSLDINSKNIYKHLVISVLYLPSIIKINIRINGTLMGEYDLNELKNLFKIIYNCIYIPFDNRIGDTIEIDLSTNSLFNQQILIFGMCKKIFNLMNIGIKKSLPENTVCPISTMEIGRSDKYMSCNGCKNVFGETYMVEWLNKKNECPMCRCKWTNNDVYINL
jgi:hypothetical protein